LCLKLLQPPRLGDRHPPVFRLPVIKSDIGDAVLPAEVLGLRSGLRLLQHRDDLFLGKTLRFHCPLPLGGLYSLSRTIRGCHLTIASLSSSPLGSLGRFQRTREATLFQF